MIRAADGRGARPVAVSTWQPSRIKMHREHEKSTPSFGIASAEGIWVAKALVGSFKRELQHPKCLRAIPLAELDPGLSTCKFRRAAAVARAKSSAEG